MMKRAIAVMVLAAACTKAADQCTSNIDCTDPAYPFCDVNGAYPASGGNTDVCTIPPPADAGVDGGIDAPVAPGGCSPGAATCATNTLSVCNPDGMTLTNTNCALGCEANGTACKSFEPSNGLGPALTAASAQPDVTFPSTVSVDTDTGVVTNAGVPVQVSSVVVTSSNATIRAFIARSFDITNILVSGHACIAFVSPGAIKIHGAFSANASNATAGPCALESPSGSVGAAGADGGGGGGNALAGGEGAGSSSASGGLPQTTFTPLTGGGRGGAGGGGTGGGGGGGLQLVSLDSIDVGAAGVIHVGGGGGQGSGDGGGAGGTVVMESPAVTVEGTIAANGGAGGACGNSGGDATADLSAAAGGQCSGTGIAQIGGNGGTATSAPTNGYLPLGGDAGAGGSVGRVDIKTQGGLFSPAGTAVLSASATIESLLVQ